MDIRENGVKWTVLMWLSIVQWSVLGEAVMKLLIS
jgi:hypothetical protein